MDLRKLRKLATVSAVALTVTFGAFDAQAQVSLTTDFTASNAINVTDTDDTTFGTWLITYDGANNVTLDLPCSTGVIGTTAAGTSQAVEVVPGTNVGTLTLTTPGAATVTMTATTVPTAFAPAGANGTQTQLYTCGTDGGADHVVAAADTQIITTAGGPNPATRAIDFGATLVFTGDPTDNTYTLTNTMDFAY